jgi:hypothetical protein
VDADLSEEAGFMDAATTEMAESLGLAMTEADSAGARGGGAAAGGHGESIDSHLRVRSGPSGENVCIPSTLQRDWGELVRTRHCDPSRQQQPTAGLPHKMRYATNSE